MNNIISGRNLRGFFGEVILRGEGHNLPYTGQIGFSYSDTPINNSTIQRKISLLEVGTSRSVEIGENAFVLTSVLGRVKFRLVRLQFRCNGKGYLRPKATIKLIWLWHVRGIEEGGWYCCLIYLLRHKSAIGCLQFSRTNGRISITS